MPRLALALLLGLLTLVLTLFSSWMDCSPQELLRHVRTLVKEGRRHQEQERERRTLAEQMEERRRIVEGVADGKLTLFEGAELCRQIGPPKGLYFDDRVRERLDTEADWCRYVLHNVAIQLQESPRRRARVLPPLLEAYRQRFGPMRS